MEDNNGQKDLKSENLRQDSNSENNIEGKNDESKDSEGADKDKESGENELNDDEEVKDENKSSEENNEKIIAPDFTLEDINGKKVSLSDYRGKIVFLNFWATWCQYCVMEMPDLEKVHQGFSKGDDAVILTVNSDEDPEKVKKFIKDNNLTLPVLMDYAYEVNWMYGISSIPVTFVIGRDGSVYGAIPGMTNKDTLLNIYESIK
ncbi:MAG TPA: redoxin domain-containing protein [Clostridiaceae bacterium]|nr:redoxin domain-containing protein [Clostridiaceae bacterium]